MIVRSGASAFVHAYLNPPAKLEKGIINFDTSQVRVHHDRSFWCLRFCPRLLEPAPFAIPFSAFPGSPTSPRRFIHWASTLPPPCHHILLHFLFTSYLHPFFFHWAPSWPRPSITGPHTSSFLASSSFPSLADHPLPRQHIPSLP